ncbi:MAG: tyrosine-protein phosphatase [Gammaproteobacteria bacterium]|nr:tyrosine-protein phosphatase [Gammaproteobacteria bacterium]
MKYVATILLFVALSTSYAEPRVRPHAWATPVIGTELENFYQVDKGVYRSRQPDDDNIPDMKSLNIKEVLNLRNNHSDDRELREGGFLLHRVKMNAGSVTEEQLIESLRIIKDRTGPILIHCWHGSDRTGVTLAAYRIVFSGWSKADALDEMRNGGYGYHERIYPNLVGLINNLDVSKVKAALGLN